MKAAKGPIHAVTKWLRRQPPKMKVFLAILSGIAALVFLRMVVHDHDKLFVAAEFVHALGVALLIYKLAQEKTCAGLSLKSQELTAIFLAVRLYCSFVMEYDIHTLLDTATLGTTLWVIYMIRFKLKSSYMDAKDNLAIYYVVIPCAVLSLLIHPTTRHHYANRILWAFCVYLEAVSVLPQLRVMQNTKIVEPFTARYVFALGVARFLSCAHWVLQVLDTRGRLLTALGYGLWPSMVLLSEIVQTFILADFCYYYIKSLVGGQLVLRLPSGVGVVGISATRSFLYITLCNAKEGGANTSIKPPLPSQYMVGPGKIILSIVLGAVTGLIRSVIFHTFGSLCCSVSKQNTNPQRTCNILPKNCLKDTANRILQNYSGKWSQKAKTLREQFTRVLRENQNQ